jgi:hypothetical protein
MRMIFLLPCRYDDFSPAWTLPVLGGNKDNDHADRLSTPRLRPGFRELTAIFGGNPLADGIAVGRGGRPRRGGHDGKSHRNRAEKGRTTFHAAFLAHRC